MAAYTESEIRASLSQLLPAAVRYPTNPVSGARDTSVTFGDMQTGSAYLFLTTPKAVHYVRYLGAQRLRSSVQAMLTSVQDTIGDLRSLRRPELRRPPSIAGLVEARSGLSQMTSALASGVFDGLGELPAYARVSRGIDIFLAESRNAITYNGEVARSKAELREQIPASWVSIQSSQQGLLTRLGYLLDETYSPAAACSLLSSRVVQAAEQLVTGHAVNLSQSTASEAEVTLRQVALDMFSVKGALSQLEQLTSPTQQVSFSGTGQPYADSAYPATPARIVSSVGPFDLRQADGTVGVGVDGQPDVNVIVPGSVDSLSLTGTSPPPYQLRSAATPAELSSKTITTFSLSGSASFYLYLAYHSGSTHVTGVAAVSLPPAVYAPADVVLIAQAAIVAAGMDAYFECTATATQVLVTALAAGSEYSAQVKLAYPLSEYLGWADGQSSVGQDVNNVLSLETNGFSEYFTLPVGILSAEDIAARIELLRSPLLLLQASAEAASYAIPPFSVVKLTSTDASSAAKLRVLPTYYDGAQDQPALAYLTLGLAGLLERTYMYVSDQTVASALATVPGIRVRVLPAGGVEVTSESTDTDSAVVISGSGCSVLFGAASVSAHGTTPWILLSDTAKVSAGDTLTLHVGVGTTTHTVTAVNGTLLRVSPEIPSNLGTVTFGSEVSPWGEIHSADWDFDSTFTQQARSWRLSWGSAASARYFFGMNRLLNAVLADKSPAASEVNDAVAYLQQLETALIELRGYIDAFQTEKIDQVDLLLRSWDAVDGQRMVDLLLSGRFDEFFSADPTQAGYGSKLASAMRDIARQDLPLSKIPYDRSRWMSTTYEEPDDETAGPGMGPEQNFL